MAKNSGCKFYRRRIATGSGVSVTELNTMLNKFFQMQKMMAKMGGGLPGMLRR